MGLIKCPECEKDVSDQAESCPNCGYPIKSNDVPRGVDVYGTWNQAQKQKPKKKNRGCLTSILVMLFVVLFFSVIIALAVSSEEKGSGSGTEEQQEIEDDVLTGINATDEQKNAIMSILSQCGIYDIKSITHDELLDNAHNDGETGYRLAVSDNIDNIIVYLSSDMSVYLVRYADYDLYANGAVEATLQDYTMTISEMTDWQLSCEETVKEVLKAPSTAEFPSITEWAFKKEKNIVTIQSYVDAQNGFGAQLRSQFQIIIDTDTNMIQSFIFDGQEMIQQ